MLGPMILLLPPLAALAAIALSRNRWIAKYAALAGCLAGLLLLPFVDRGTESAAWFSGGGATFVITTLMGPLNVLLAAAVLVVGILASLYSFRFADLPSEKRRFCIGMLAIETSVLAITMAGNFMLLLIAWGFLGASGYLLRGFRGGARASAAARRFLTLVLVGDVALIASTAILFTTYGSLEFNIILGSLRATPIPRSAAALLALAALTWPADLILTVDALSPTFAFFSRFIEILGDGFAYFDESLDNALYLLGRALSRLGRTKRAGAGINAYVLLFAVGILLLLVAMVFI